MNTQENKIDIKSRCKSVSGSGGSFFYFTRDKKFILKSINNEEFDMLSRILNDYIKRLSSEIPSLIAKVYGIFQISIGSSSPKILILMENLSMNLKDPLIFDLKGSIEHRRTTLSSYLDFKSMPKDKIYKDVDLFWVGEIISLDNEDAEAITLSLELDSKLFEEYGIMDYSMLLLIETVEQNTKVSANSINCFQMKDYEMRIGIIDFLQSYSTSKKLHTTINTIRTDFTLNSCVPPDIYRKRFIEMVKSIFFKD